METTILWLFGLWFIFLPGALFMWSYGLSSGWWTTDRQGSRHLLMSIGYSAVFHLLFAPVTYNIWSTYWKDISQGREVSLWLWAALSIYVLIPGILGLFSGWATLRTGVGLRKWYEWTRYIMGRTQNPQAWDFLFSRNDLNGWIRFRTKEGRFLGGYYGKGSYVSRYPEPQDIYLDNLAEIDSTTGEIKTDEEGNPKLLGSGLLLRWDEVEYLEFKKSEDTQAKQNGEENYG